MLRRLTAVVFALAFSGCASPSLPLPPPDDPTMSPGVDTDHVKLSGACGNAEPDAIIIIVNTNTTVANDQAVSGSRSDSCGAWDAMVYAHSGDFLDITQEVGDQSSTPLVLEVR